MTAATRTVPAGPSSTGGASSSSSAPRSTRSNWQPRNDIAAGIVFIVFLLLASCVVLVASGHYHAKTKPIVVTKNVPVTTCSQTIEYTATAGDTWTRVAAQHPLAGVPAPIVRAWDVLRNFTASVYDTAVGTPLTPGEHYPICSSP